MEQANYVRTLRHNTKKNMPRSTVSEQQDNIFFFFRNFRVFASLQPGRSHVISAAMNHRRGGRCPSLASAVTAVAALLMSAQTVRGGVVTRVPRRITSSRETAAAARQRPAGGVVQLCRAITYANPENDTNDPGLLSISWFIFFVCFSLKTIMILP